MRAIATVIRIRNNLAYPARARTLVADVQCIVAHESELRWCFTVCDLVDRVERCGPCQADLGLVGWTLR